MCPFPIEQPKSFTEKLYPKPLHQLRCFDVVDIHWCHTSVHQYEPKLAEQGLKKQQSLRGVNGLTELFIYQMLMGTGDTASHSPQWYTVISPSPACFSGAMWGCVDSLLMPLAKHGQVTLCLHACCVWEPWKNNLFNLRASWTLCAHWRVN